MPSLSCGIIGLPNAGKSTLFNALTQAGAEVAAYPFCTIEPNVGRVPVRDPRVDRVAELVGVSSRIYHTVEYVDVAGLVKGASKGEGRGNQFLENVRACQALVHVVRCFEDRDVAHVHGRIDPCDDIATINLELALADLETAERGLARFAKAARREPDAKRMADLLARVIVQLESEQPVRALDLTADDRDRLAEFRFLTAKPVLYAANVDESDLPEAATDRVAATAAVARDENNAVVPICARIESEIAGLEPAEARLFLDDFGLAEPGLDRLVRATASLLELISFLTFNENEVRAWRIRDGATAVEAAGEVHTDFAEKFIRAEVTTFDDFDRAEGKKGAHDEGLTRTEGRDYVVHDGDVIYFRIGP